MGAILHKTLEYERKGSLNDFGFLQTSHFVTSWELETFLSKSEGCTSGDEISSLTCDGKFLYLITGESEGLLKIGTGKLGTMR